jgi:hypothetical protein
MSKRHTILVLDDEPDIVKSVRDLPRLEHEVLGATSAADGIMLLEELEAQLPPERAVGKSGPEVSRVD